MHEVRTDLLNVEGIESSQPWSPRHAARNKDVAARPHTRRNKNGRGLQRQEQDYYFLRPFFSKKKVLKPKENLLLIRLTGVRLCRHVIWNCCAAHVVSYLSESCFCCLPSESCYRLVKWFSVRISQKSSMAFSRRTFVHLVR